MEEEDRESEEFSIRTSSEGSQRALTEFHTGVADHIGAIQTAGREFLAQHASAGSEGLRTIRVEISVGPARGEAESQSNSTDCWDADYICGKGPSGYIHCTAHVCMEVGPITVAP